MKHTRACSARNTKVAWQGWQRTSSPEATSSTMLYGTAMSACLLLVP